MVNIYRKVLKKCSNDVPFVMHDKTCISFPAPIGSNQTNHSFRSAKRSFAAKRDRPQVGLCIYIKVKRSLDIDKNFDLPNAY